MCDVTGTGWLKHMMYGTSKIMQLRGPERHLTGSGREFFLTFRVFEICRALIYSTNTYLAERKWRDLTEEIKNDGVDWHPKEALFDLMISVSELSNKCVLLLTIEHLG